MTDKKKKEGEKKRGTERERHRKWSFRGACEEKRHERKCWDVCDGEEERQKKKIREQKKTKGSSVNTHGETERLKKNEYEM